MEVKGCVFPVCANFSVLADELAHSVVRVGILN